jgi:lipid-binding SYLF domain-containing protein
MALEGETITCKDITMKRLLCLLAFLCLLPAAAHAADLQQQRDSIFSMRSHTLSRLYHVKPYVREDIRHSVGYAVFSSGSLAFIYVSGGYGHGVAHDNRTNRDTFMDMAEGGLGLGLGAKDARTIFVFHDAKAFHDFVTTGLDLTGKADADAKENMKGGAADGQADVLPGVHIYQITKTGLMAQAMVQGTKYWIDGDLNNSPASVTESRQ